MMAVNVFGIIIPNQKKITASLLAGQAPDPALGAIGKQRSVHNNYLTLPVLVMMVSNHYPMLTGFQPLWLIVALTLALALVSQIDDRRGLPARVRFTAHLAAVAALLVVYPAAVPVWLLVPIGFLMLWLINLYNFMDGIDGLAGGMAALPVGLMGLLGQTSGQLETLVIEASTVMTRADIAAYNAGIRPLLGSVFIATAFSFGLVPIVAQYAKGVRSDHSFEFIISLGLRILGGIGLGISVVCFLFAEPIMTIFGAQFTHDAVDAAALHAHAGAYWIDAVVVALHGHLGALTGLAHDALDGDQAVGHFGHLLFKQLGQEFRRRAR